MRKTSPEIVLLRQALEQSVNRLMRTPSDFEFLAGAIWERTRTNFSPTTLKRLWGYIDGADNTRACTLDILSRFLGFDNWEAFMAHTAENSDEESDILLGKSLCSSDVAVGDLVRVSWLPNRCCTFRCTAVGKFVVVEAENSKLQVGDRFECSFFMLHEPLYIDNLVQQNHAPVAFVCGNKQGLIELQHIPASGEN